MRSLSNTFDELLRLLESTIKICDNDSIVEKADIVYQCLCKRLTPDHDMPEDADRLVPAIYATVDLLMFDDEGNQDAFYTDFNFITNHQADKDLKGCMTSLSNARFTERPGVLTL